MRPAEYHAAGVITDKELAALELEPTMSQWQIAYALGISRGAARDRLKNAHRKMLLYHQEAA